MDKNQLRKLAGLPPLSKVTITEIKKPYPTTERHLQQLTERAEKLIDQIIEMNAELMDFSAFLDTLSFDNLSEIQRVCDSAAAGLQDVIEVTQMELELHTNNVYDNN